MELSRDGQGERKTLAWCGIRLQSVEKRHLPATGTVVASTDAATIIIIIINTSSVVSAARTSAIQLLQGLLLLLLQQLNCGGRCCSHCFCRNRLSQRLVVVGSEVLKM